jgi:hypothetical protein
MTISEFLNSLPPAGDGSFEDLIGELLEALTGLRFHPARSGDQRGRDARATGVAGGAIVFECKRYSGATPLKDRELVGELQQAHIALPQLDVWILAASREITDQNLAELEAAGREEGIDILPLESLVQGVGNLDILVAAFPEVVKRFANEVDFNTLQPGLIQAQQTPRADDRLATIKGRLLDPNCGWPTWRVSSHTEWLRTIAEETAARSRWGQPLNVSSSQAVPRLEAEKALEEWWKDNRSTIFAMTGEEGDGKSWAVARWLTQRIQDSGETFPPVVFIPSQDAGEGKSFENLALETMRGLSLSGEWVTKLHRWLEHDEASKGQPVAVVVLDGLNERHTQGYWRSLIESSFAKPWMGRIRLICTARSQYWKEFFADLPSMPQTRLALGSFSDSELRQALRQQNLDLSEFAEELRPLLRKPRYFKLAVRFREQMSQAGDFTLARLFFEDWRDRCEHSDRQMSEQGFNSFLRQVAERFREDGTGGLRKGDIEEFIGYDANTRDAFRELATGGVLRKQGTQWVVSEDRLPLALGLLLSDKLEIAASDARSLQEEIASWLEPHTGSDLEALIIEYALLASVAQGAPSPIVAGLLRAWIDTQNPRSPVGSPIERRLCAYVPRCLDAYVDLAESVWSTQGNHPWAQEVLLRGFADWSRKSAPVLKGLIPVLQRWLTMVPLNGPPMYRKEPDGKPAPDRDATVRALWPEAVPNRDYQLAGYSLQLIDDDGWLRLSHAAFVIISFLEDRRPLVEAFTRFCLAKSIHESADGGNEMRWTIRTSEFNLEPDFESHIQRLLQDKCKIAQMALSRILRFLGSTSAWRRLSEIDEDSLFPTSEEESKARKNPVESGFACSKAELEAYARRESFNPAKFIHSAQDLVTDPDLDLPSGFAQRFAPVVVNLKAQSVWQGRFTSGEDHWLKLAEVVLARIDPSAIAGLIRSIVNNGGTRSLDTLARLASILSNYDLLLNQETRESLETLYRTNPEIKAGTDDLAKQIEYYLFSRVLPIWRGTEQLNRVLARPDDAFDWIDFEHSYQGPVDAPLPTVVTSRSLFRMLYYLSIIGEGDVDAQTLKTAFASDDSLVRGALFRYMYFCEWTSPRIKPFLLGWFWKPEMHAMEQTFGSLLLLKLMADEKTVEWARVDPTYHATALLTAGSPEGEWTEYATWFAKMVQKLNTPLPNGDLPAYEIAFSKQETGRPGQVSLAPSPPNSVRIVAPETHWGGRSSDQPFAPLTETPEAIRDRRMAQYKQLETIAIDAFNLGNFWLQRCFPMDAIEANLDRARDIINDTIRWISEQQTPKVPYTAFTFYSALTEALFSRPERVGDAVLLYQALRASAGSVRIVDSDTGLTRMDLVLFDAPETDQTRVLWAEEYWACTTDADLLELAIMVRQSQRRASAEWLERVVAEGIASASPYEFARAAALRGFLETNPEAGWLSLAIADDSPWTDNIVHTAQDRVKAERNARHWFRRFCEAQGMDEAWSGFRLFLKCADRRCWLWCHKEMLVLGEEDRRRSFFESNRDEVRKACRENEKRMSDKFLGADIVEDMSPWKK